MALEPTGGEFEFELLYMKKICTAVLVGMVRAYRPEFSLGLANCKAWMMISGQDP